MRDRCRDGLRLSGSMPAKSELIADIHAGIRLREPILPSPFVRERAVDGDNSKDEVVVLRSSAAMAEADGGGDGQSE
jgi:hypothetical protein